MKIVFAGGGTGGHFYPIIAVAQKVNKVITEEKLVGVKLYYISDDPFDKELLLQNEIIFEEITAGKMRTYFSLKNFSDLFKTFWGVLRVIFKMYSLYPDVVFGKGGYASFPTIFAARVLGIPVIIHESDSAPGRVNKWAGRFAKRVAVSFNEAVKYFPESTVAWTGQPIRVEVEHPAIREDAISYFKLESNLPVILILGGSQGAELINNVILGSLPRLVQNFQIIHQTGVKNFKNVSSNADVILGDNINKSRYMPMPFLNNLTLKMASGAATIIVSRAGSTIFEIASWGVPSILIPFNESNGDHARKNAYNYAHAGACVVIEETNLTSNILSSEIERLCADGSSLDKMAKKAKAFNKPDAAYKIAKEIVEVALSHEQ